MKTNDIRKKFIEYFKQHDHLEAESSSLVPDEDTLLLTTAGMVQMMPYILSKKNPPHIRMCSVQKCIRTNDIDEVGKDGRHGTFFEMLGSWSFGDYYKKEAIHLAYDLLVNVYGYDKDKLWATVFKGDNDIPKDEESIKYWLEEGIPQERIKELGKDNFWGPPGEAGPCGPSTEIYYDLGENVGDGKNCIGPGCDCDRFLEIWNAGVFMEYYKDIEGKYSPLPQKNVDTGAGLERMACFLQGKTDMFDTDLLREIVNYVSNKLNINDYDSNFEHKKSVKIITDHIRTSVFLISDSVFPSNEHRGYILRKLLRRAMAQVRINNGQTPFFDDVIDLIVDLYKVQYPNLEVEKENVKNIIKQEEQKFAKTLNNGLKVLQKIYSQSGEVKGDDIFKLQDTFGLPPEISIDLMNGLGIKYDESSWDDSYKKLLDTQKNKSRIGSTFTLGKIIEKKFDGFEKTEFTGYSSLKEESNIIYIERTEGEYLIVTSKTPMYAESGGQAGDKGTMLLPNGTINITNVKKTKKGVIIHIAERNEENDSIIQIPEDINKEIISVSIEVDEINRRKSSNNHTATHILHSAVRIVFGTSSHQKGSYLDASRIRFDFTCDKNITEDEIKKIENIVNEEIKKAEDVYIKEMSLGEAKESNALCLFEGRYSDVVRTIKVGDFSFELCGGTHASNTSDLGTFKILKVESISKGVKRIRAVLE